MFICQQLAGHLSGEYAATFHTLSSPERCGVDRTPDMQSMFVDKIAHVMSSTLSKSVKKACKPAFNKQDVSVGRLLEKPLPTGVFVVYQ